MNSESSPDLIRALASLAVCVGWVNLVRINTEKAEKKLRATFPKYPIQDVSPCEEACLQFPASAHWMCF
ncbi:hypothetical protein GN956_G9236 [Arapaima gigas]